MHFRKISYEKLKSMSSSGWTKTIKTVEDNSPLAQAVERKANENPDHVVMGVSLNDEIKYVEVVPELDLGGGI